MKIPHNTLSHARSLLSSRGIDWQFLLSRTILYASSHVNRWRWRGSLGGVLPDGFDPSSIAAEAFYDLFTTPGQEPAPIHLIANAQAETTILLRSLERRVRTIVNRLHHRTENRLLRNEPDLALATLDDGQSVSIVDLIPEAAPSPDAALVESESSLQFQVFKVQFSAFIGRERRLLKLLDLYCQDCYRPADIAARLKLSRSAVRNLQKRFLRRWAAFRKSRSLSSPQTRS